jgi:hypothetical protein
MLFSYKPSSLILVVDEVRRQINPSPNAKIVDFFIVCCKEKTKFFQ